MLISGFTVIPVAYAHSTHILYVRAHISKTKDVVYPEGRTLFLVNVPIDATDREISLFFKYCGTVERVVYNRESSHDTEAEVQDEEEAERETSQPHSHPTKTKSKRQPTENTTAPPSIVPLPPLPTRPLHKTGGIAHVVFLDASSLAKALVPPPGGKPRSWPSSEEPRGLAHYAALYDAQRPPLDVVKAHADSWMARFEFDVQKTRRAGAGTYHKGEAIVDEDGFTLVTRGGAYGQTLGGGMGVASKTFEKTGRTGSRKKKAPKEKEAFYAFQRAEKQRQGEGCCVVLLRTD